MRLGSVCECRCDFCGGEGPCIAVNEEYPACVACLRESLTALEAGATAPALLCGAVHGPSNTRCTRERGHAGIHQLGSSGRWGIECNRCRHTLGATGACPKCEVPV